MNEAWITTLVVLNTLGSMGVLWRCICALNHMSRKTRFSIRLAYILVALGAAASLCAPSYLGRPPTRAEVLLVVGFALLSFADRRRRVYLRPEGQR